MTKYKLLTLFRTCIILVGCLIWTTACDQGEDLDTNQLSDGNVTLKSFGPSPIPRGAELRLIGSHLDRVESVTFQGTAAVSDIKKISSNEIRVTVPQNAQPGIITLTAGGKTISSVTGLTFEETIIVNSISPLSVKAGNTLKIEGDYLNLIEEIIFAEDVHVLKAAFKSQSRTAIEVVVPLEAQTGKIIVSDGADLAAEDEEPGIPVWVYSDDELVVALPVVTKVSPDPVKAGSLLTIEGTNFDLVKSIVFADDITVEAKDFVSRTATKIEINVPADSKEGDAQLIAFSGVAVNLSLGLTAPTISAIAPNPVKNGATLTITGQNLDLVSQVVFGGDTEGTIAEKSSAKIEVSVPLDAVDGVVTFHTLSGKTVQSAALSFVKPTIESISPATITAGESITIQGTNLDLVSAVIFGGSTTGEIVSQSETEIVAKSLPNSQTDRIILEMTNGTQITSSQSITINSDRPVILTIPSSVKPGGLLTITGTKLNLVEFIVFEGNAMAVRYGTRTETLIEVYVPEEAKKGVVTFTMFTNDGKTVVSPPFAVSGTDPVSDESYVFFDFDGKNSWWGSFGSVENDPDLSMSGNYFRINENLTGSWIDFFWRNGANNFKTDGVTVDDWVIKMDVNVLGATTPPFRFRLNGTDGDYWAIFGGLTNRGGWYTVTIPLTDFVDDSGRGSNHLPNVQNITSDFGLALAGEGETNICIDNIRFEKK